MTTSFTILRNDSLMSTHQTDKHWLWKGFLAAGEITLFTAMWKSGKSTLISVLLAKMKQGGELAGQSVSPARVLVVSEEAPEKWAERGHKLGFSDHLFWVCRPFTGRPTLEEWYVFLTEIIKLQQNEKIDLVVFDSLSNLAPLRSENDAGEMLKAISPLQELTKRGLAILITHHPRKGAARPGQAARGSGALCAFVDCIIEMNRTSSRHARDRRRRLNSYSRHDETPAKLVIELNNEGNEYLTLGENGELGFDRGWPIIKDILERADLWSYMSVFDILRKWPAGFAPPARRTLQEWFKKAWENHMAEQTGEGNKGDPYRYCLPGMVEVWQARFNAELLESLERREKPCKKNECAAPTKTFEPEEQSAPAPDDIPTPESPPDTTNRSEPTPPSTEDSAIPPSSCPVDNPMPKPHEPPAASPAQNLAEPPTSPPPDWPTYDGDDPITALAVSQQRYAAALAQRCAEMHKKATKPTRGTYSLSS